jgi:DnaJ-class molecular chaperone
MIRSNEGANNIEIDLPVGVSDGETVRYAKLAPGNRDLIVQFRINPSADWQRDGNNLITSITVPIWDLIVGGCVTATTILDQEIIVNIPPRTQPGALLRVRGHGLLDKRNNKGDMLLKVQGSIPDEIPDHLVDAIHAAKSK